ncbi:NADH-dependent flavin oxidoreductase [Priestia megaterium]|nr:NADH-dependent flavin oxidoreductase [Priestia megaterium]PVE79870.1 NADH-dependent flavin oxidoreductase [Priestia megaterium]PVE83777.1 NADH-dependent flavin oxidoreductase [Priestia megaterium]PVE99545.1 NADH-dependent flavin oxidoreductase [Priestia megaterium]
MMKQKYQKLFEPFTFPSGVTVNNRILMAPMTTASSFKNGMVTNDELAYYEKRSGGVGAVITACAYVTREGNAFSGGFSADSDKMIPSLTKLAKTIQDKGSKAILQIFHGGRMVSPQNIGGQAPVSASAVRALRDEAVTPREMTNEEIQHVIQGFGEATRRAIEAGFDGIEIHGANTYLIQQFFSPHSNRRTDKWGGNLEKRMRFPLAIADSISQVVKEHAKKPFLIGYRISPEEIEEPGIAIEDTLQLLDQLTEKQLDYIHLSIGTIWRGSIRNSEQTTPLLERIKERIGHKIPLMGVGSIHHPDDAIEALNKEIPLVALGRQLLIEPEWVQKVQNGEVDVIRQSMSLKDQEKQVIPDPMWENITSIPGWLPIEENKEQGNNEPWLKSKN